MGSPDASQEDLLGTMNDREREREREREKEGERKRESRTKHDLMMIIINRECLISATEHVYLS